MQRNLRIASERGGKKNLTPLEHVKDQAYACLQPGDKALDWFAKETFPDYAEIFWEVIKVLQ